MFFLLLLFIFPTTPTADIPAYTPTDLILLSCGRTSISNDLSGRKWDPDEHSKYKPANAASISNASQAFRKDPSGTAAPYDTARVFRSPFAYSFPVNSTGHKFIRLHFYPDTYAGIDTTELFFSVTGNGYNLLSNFSAFLNSPSWNQPSVMKEFIINVEGDKRINLTFSPNPNSFAFINGIEIVSLPENLYFRNTQIKLLPNRMIYLKNDTALATLYRLNVGGAYVQIQDDTGMFRYWFQDDDYIFGADYGYTPHDEGKAIHYTNATPEYTAPKIVYRTFRSTSNTSISLEWAFPVDTGFQYLLRFHFCEILQEITKQNQRSFTININNETAEAEADVIFWTGGSGIPIFKDYIVWVRDNHTHHGKTDLRLSLFFNKEDNPMYESAFLNGLEIFKLSDSNQSLAGANPNPQPSPVPPPPRPVKKKTGASVIYVVVGSVISVLAVVAAVSFLIFRRQRKVKEESSGASPPIKTSVSGEPLPSDLCRRFTLREIATATGNFDNANIIGRGGFGYVYKGIINNGATTVAIKRLNASSKQGAREFFTEIEMLSQLRHVHLVSLIGYCSEPQEMILVYEYMEYGTMYDHLHKTENTPLNWKQRLQICLGAAKGLQYLHTGVKNAIIHRDVKTTNILLDKNWVAKMSDFGLSKVGPTENTHVSTAVKGTFGYVDPEYYKTSQLTEKSDVYSFGVVLLEALCGRPAILHNISTEQLNLVAWVKKCHEKEIIDQIIDSNLKGQIGTNCLNKFVETAIKCLQDRGNERPSMSDVVASLELALQLQEGMEVVSDGSRSVAVGQKDLDSTDGEMFSSTSDNVMWSKSSGLASTESSEKHNSMDVFSEIMNSRGR